jgi:glycosyltransferase involved in cell wall biosynthesis
MPERREIVCGEAHLGGELDAARRIVRLRDRAGGAMTLPTRRHDDSRLRLLFIARAYPPTLGGMENFALQLRSHLETHAEVRAIVNTRGKRALPLFLPYATLDALRIARGGSVDAIHLADASLAPLGVMLKRLTGLTVTASVCGLDVTYANGPYRALVHRALRQLDMVMPISHATEAVMHGLAGPSLKSSVVRLGLNSIAPSPGRAVAAMHTALAPHGERILLTSGRLIARKGVEWFTREVLPRLDADVVYAIVGAGPRREAIARAAAEAGVKERIRMLGRVDDGTLAAAYGAADVFVMPNVPVAGDFEGFGLVALEASSAGLPVIAAKLEGITEAVTDGQNGLLVPPLDAGAWISAIEQLLALPIEDRQALGQRFAACTVAEYSWERTASAYARIIGAVCGVRASREPIGVVSA